MKFQCQSRMTLLLSVGFLMTCLGCIALAYLWIDRSITLSYLEASHETTADALSRVSLLLEGEWNGLSEADLLRKLREANRRSEGEALIKREENVIWFDTIRFEFESGRLRKIE